MLTCRCGPWLAHIDLESLIMDSKVRRIRDQLCIVERSHALYNGMYFSPEREFIEDPIVFSPPNDRSSPDEGVQWQRLRSRPF